MEAVGDGRTCRALLGIDFESAVGKRTIEVSAVGKDGGAVRAAENAPGAFGEVPDPEAEGRAGVRASRLRTELARIAQDREKVKRVYAAADTRRRFEAAFQRPVESRSHGQLRRPSRLQRSASLPARRCRPRGARREAGVRGGAGGRRARGESLLLRQHRDSRPRPRALHVLLPSLGDRRAARAKRSPESSGSARSAPPVAPRDLIFTGALASMGHASTHSTSSSYRGLARRSAADVADSLSDQSVSTFVSFHKKTKGLESRESWPLGRNPAHSSPRGR